MTRRMFWISIIAAFFMCLAGGGSLSWWLSGIAADTALDDLSLTASVASQTPGGEEMVMKALKTRSEAQIETGRTILHQYGYDHSVLTQKYVLHMAPYAFSVSMAVFFIFTLFFVFSQFRLHKRISQLTTALYQINRGRQTLIPSGGEDLFSRLEDEAAKTVNSLSLTKESALNDRKALADNLSDLSHQLKTPIASMALMTDLLENDASEEQRSYIERLKTQIDRLSRLIEALLTLSKLDSHTLIFEEKPIDIESMVQAAVDTLYPLFNEKEQTVHIESAPPAHFNGDFYWSVEALINLLKNCSEHTPIHGTISISWESSPLYIQLSIHDSGSGFSKEDLPHLWKRFYRGKNASKNSVGIGLALSKTLIEHQNGAVSAENAPDGGALFVLRFYRNK